MATDKQLEKINGNQGRWPWGSIVIVTLCAIWIIARLIYFYNEPCGGGQGACDVEQENSALSTPPSALSTSPSAPKINGILASDLDLLRTKAVDDPMFKNAFKRLTDRRRELAAQQVAIDFDYKNWLNSWSTTNLKAQVKIAIFRDLASQDQNDPKVAAKMTRLAGDIRKIVGNDPVGSALLARCDALLPETEAVEKLYTECVRAMTARSGKDAPASKQVVPDEKTSQPVHTDLSALQAGPVSEPVSFAAPAVVSTNTTSDVKAAESSGAETKELKE